MAVDLEKYEVVASKDFLEFIFYSEGPKGRIKKMIRFTKRQYSGENYYNLGFGNWNETWKKIDDRTKNNNGDADKILATVASTVIYFNRHYPDAILFAKGSTASRTRKYQMGINKYLNEIETVYEVFGLSANGQYEPFKHGINYLSFRAVPKMK